MIVLFIYLFNHFLFDIFMIIKLNLNWFELSMQTKIVNK